MPLLLTRPEAQGAGFADEVAARFGSRIRLIKTPLLAPRFYAPTLPAGKFSALIVTSKTGVEAYSRLSGDFPDLPKTVYCVGESTAALALAAGLKPLCAAPDANHLIQQIIRLQPTGPLLHLRGRDARGDVAKHLDNAGIETEVAVVYAQEGLPLTADAERVLRAASPVLVPLFSPRTASIFASEMVRIGGISPLFLATMSGEVALEAGALSAQIKVAMRPDSTAMCDTLALLLADMQRA